MFPPSAHPSICFKISMYKWGSLTLNDFKHYFNTVSKTNSLKKHFFFAMCSYCSYQVYNEVIALLFNHEALISNKDQSSLI